MTGLAIALIQAMSFMVGVTRVDWFASGPTPTRREDPLAELTKREREVLGRTLSRRRPAPRTRLPIYYEARLPDEATSFEPSDQPLDDGGLRKLLRRSKRVWQEQPCA